MTNTKNQRTSYTVQEVAERIGCSDAMIWKKLRNKEINGLHTGGGKGKGWRLTRNDLIQWLGAKHTAELFPENEGTDHDE